MIVKTSKKNEALDTNKSSAFLLYGNKKGFHITQECYDKIMSLELYSYNRKTGEEKLSKDINYRALNLVYRLHKINSEKKLNETNWKYYGVDSLREISEDYYQQILDKLVETEIITVEIEHKTIARKIWVNEKWLSGEKLNIVDKKYWNVVKKLKDKLVRNGKKHTSDKKVHVNISKNEFFEMFKYNKDYDEKHYIGLWNNVELINKTGEISACQKRKKRSYSLFTSLPSKLHNRITLDGRYLCEMDGHCTYFSLLPAIIDIEIRKRIKKPFKTIKDQEILENLLKDNAKLREVIRNTTDIYNLFVDETHDRNYIKTIFNSFLNDPVYKNYYDVVENYIKVNFPYILMILDEFRKHNKFFYSVQKIEVDIYIRTAKTLKKREGIDILCKHDNLAFFPENLEIVRKELVRNMDRYNIHQNLKIVDHSLSNQPTVESPTDSVSNFVALTDDNSKFPTTVLTPQPPYLPCSISIEICEKELQNDQLKLQIKATDKVKATKKKRESKIKEMTDGRWTIKLNGRQINSWKKESKEEFILRLENLNSERSEVVSEASEIKSLTTESKGVILDSVDECKVENNDTDPNIVITDFLKNFISKGENNG